jgi:hypothetical protein
LRRVASGLLLAASTIVVTAAPAAAHGIGVRGDLPLPFYQFAWGAAAAVIISFVALGALWKRSILEDAAAGRPTPVWLDRAVGWLAIPARVVSFTLFLLVLAAGLFGESSVVMNVAPVTVYVIFWVGLQVASAVLGDIWRALSPFETIALLIARVRPAASREPSTQWIAAGVLAGFLWLELAFERGSSPRTVGWALLFYTLALVVGIWRWGQAWLRNAEGFGVLFSMLAKMAPLYRDSEERLRVRWPCAGLTTIRPVPGTVELVLIVLGGTTFDGLSGSELWRDLVGVRTGLEFTIVYTLGMAWTIAVVAALYYGASYYIGRVVGRGTQEIAGLFVHSLVPIVLGYAIAHYFSLLVIEGQQRFRIVLSDPFGRGWNMFGTADDRVDFLLVGTRTIAWVQVLAIVLAHVAGVMIAHDRALREFPRSRAVQSQYPMLFVMVTYSVVGLWLLLSA